VVKEENREEVGFLADKKGRELDVWVRVLLIIRRRGVGLLFLWLRTSPLRQAWTPGKSSGNLFGAWIFLVSLRLRLTGQQREGKRFTVTLDVERTSPV